MLNFGGDFWFFMEGKCLGEVPDPFGGNVEYGYSLGPLCG